MPCVPVCVCAYAHMCPRGRYTILHMCMHMRMLMCTHMHMPTHMHTHMHMHMHMCAGSRALTWAMPVGGTPADRLEQMELTVMELLAQVCVWACVCVCACVCATHVYGYVHVYVHRMRICNACACACACACMRVRVHACVCGDGAIRTGGFRTHLRMMCMHAHA